MSIGAKIRKARLAKDMTQRALAEATGLNYVTVNRIEKGVVTKIYPDTLKALAQTLEVSADYLLGLDDTLSTSTKPTKRRRTSQRKATAKGDTPQAS